MKPRLALFAAIFAAAALPAWAHDDATLDTMKSPNGGQVRMAGVYHFELLLARDSKEAKDNPVIVFVTDHADGKVASKGMKATVTMLGGGQKASVELQPDGDNRLKGTARYASAADLKAVVAVTLPDGKVEQARFTPFAKAAPDPHAGHKH
ncbi:hypothetical protein [Sulfuritalea sp.]|uniref:hypothetical protein n=1 Tax=Sulfuritalea sp. TaxID=2480090 RepID=UPI001AD5B202|nr:hypothetical protein [Sulfuritalea sp.]MBN8474042.1 hypothetical protein [Sulfuritalea sp.]